MELLDVIEYVRASEGITLPEERDIGRYVRLNIKEGRPKIDERDEVQLLCPGDVP
jgi:CRISPR-associated exonuclease Cas4